MAAVAPCRHRQAVGEFPPIRFHEKRSPIEAQRFASVCSLGVVGAPRLSAWMRAGVNSPEQRLNQPGNVVERHRKAAPPPAPTAAELPLPQAKEQKTLPSREVDQPEPQR